MKKILMFVVSKERLVPEQTQRKLKGLEGGIKEWMQEHGLDKEYIPFVTTEPIQISSIEIV